jgi:hypothetical protein
MTEALISIEIRCPTCGEVNDIQLERASWGTMVQDCWVCCRPFELDVRWGERDEPPTVRVEPAE